MFVVSITKRTPNQKIERMAKQTDSTSWYKHDPNLPTPNSTTCDSLEAGRKLQNKFRQIARKQLNFVSYPMNNFRFNLMKMDKKNEIGQTTTYKQHFLPPYKPVCETPKHVVEEPPDWQLNRRPVCLFDMQPWASFKFMDDQLINLSKARMKTNFFRQLRNSSSI